MLPLNVFAVETSDICGRGVSWRLDGDVLYKVKAGTKTDTKVRLRGKGVPYVHNQNKRGDHYVTLMIQTPTKLSKEAKAALKKFDQLTGNTLSKEES